MATDSSITIEEKRDALEHALASEVFARSEQLRHFLKYVCEMEITGRGRELNEYLIGVEVLRRPEGYSPANDSSVRTRAYELRQKLDRYYATESPGNAIRIEVPKGSYAPVFVQAATPAAPPLQPEKPADAASRSNVRWLLTAAFAGGALVMLAGGALWLRGRIAPGVDPVIREAWGPLAHPGANVLICIGSFPHLVIRPQFAGNPGGVPTYPAADDLYPYFRKQRPLNPGVRLFEHATDNALDFGELRAVVTAANTLRSMGVNYQLLPERATPLAAIRGRNAILVGNAQNSNVAGQELLRGGWTIDFDLTLQRMAIVDQTAKNRPTPFTGSQGRPGEPSWCCGLITVLPSEGSSNKARTVIISGITSAGANAAMEYLASPAALGDLRRRFAQEHLAGFPAAYQIVVKCRSRDSFLLASEYAAHRVLQR